MDWPLYVASIGAALVAGKILGSYLERYGWTLRCDGPTPHNPGGKKFYWIMSEEKHAEMSWKARRYDREHDGKGSGDG